jgi:hypothetical protein
MGLRHPGSQGQRWRWQGQSPSPEKPVDQDSRTSEDDWEAKAVSGISDGRV